MHSTTGHLPATKPILPISLRRPRWTNIALAASLVIFWTGVILKIFG